MTLARRKSFMRTLATDGRTWSPIQQLSRAKGNAGRPVSGADEKSIADCLDGNRWRGLPRRSQKRNGGPMKRRNFETRTVWVTGWRLFILLHFGNGPRAGNRLVAA